MAIALVPTAVQCSAMEQSRSTDLRPTRIEMLPVSLAWRLQRSSVDRSRLYA